MSLAAAPHQLDALTDRACALARSRERVIIAIAGAPGAGKSTVTEAVAAELQHRGVDTAVIPMDGFHLANVELARLGLAQRKGAIDTFDAYGYLALLRRLRDRREPIVYAPTYIRGSVEQPLGSAIPVGAHVRVVLTEGNYLLMDTEPWTGVAELADETWFVQPDESDRRERLLARHLANGKPQHLALEFTDGSDAANATLVAPSAQRADLIIDCATGALP